MDGESPADRAEFELRRADHKRRRGSLHSEIAGSKLAAQLGRLLSLKDAAHYGVQIVSSRNAADAIRWVARLVERAREEIER
jgi:hypothetical protein